MSEAAQQQGIVALPLHAVWYAVLKPGLVAMPNGQPGFEMIAQHETMAGAAMQANLIPGARIVLHAVVHVSPDAKVPASSLIRPL